MLYLLDASVLIEANRSYYPLDRVPEFWDWLEFHGKQGDIKIPVEIYEEFKDGEDDLGVWARSTPVREALVLREEAEVALVARVVEEGYVLAGDETHLEEAQRLLSFARDHAPEEFRESMIANVPLHRDIMAEWEAWRCRE